MSDVGLFASKTEFLLLELLLGNSLLVATFHLLDSVSVTNGVKSILAAGVGRRNVGNHGGLRVANEGVLEDLGELGASEGRVLFVQVEGPDALL